MVNNALFGFMLQNSICRKFNIVLDNERVINTFNANYDNSISSIVDEIVDDVFNNVKLTPVECTTFNIDYDGKEVPYNFVLSDNSTLSIRTNVNGCKVAPRTVGQAGFEKLNIYFSDIYGKKIDNQDDIKHLICESPERVLPIFFEHLFDADYILWIFQDEKGFSFHLLKGDSGIDIDYEKKYFSFTKDYDEWNESTTLKYKGKSIAEIQVHKNRSFKFRFIMKNVVPMIVSRDKNNETLGITAEKTICDLFHIEYPANFFNRYSPELQYQISDAIENAFRYLPVPIKHLGSEVGERGGRSKSSCDFLLSGDKTLSLKTNIGKMVCPPEIGQPNNLTCYLYFKDLISEKHIDANIFKKMVFDNIDKMIPKYLNHLFDSDYLLRIYVDKATCLNGCSLYQYEIFDKNFGKNFVWNRELFSFSKNSIEEWKESNTVYYKKIPLGEFQIHRNRNCFKFRFNFRNLVSIIRNKK